MKADSEITIAHAPTAERRALCLLSWSPEKIADHAWDRDLFHLPANREIFEAIHRRAVAGLGTDLLAVQSELETVGRLESVGGSAGLTDVLTIYGGPMPRELPSIFQALSSARAYRRAQCLILERAPEVADMSADLPALAAQLADIAQPRESSRRASLSDHLLSLVGLIENNNPPESFGFGIPALDAKLAGGIRRKELCVTTAATGGGKSVLLAMAALEAARAGKKVVFYSVEMPAPEVVGRMVANLSGFTVREGGAMTKQEFAAINRGIESIRTMPLQVIDDTAEMLRIEAEARTLANTGKLDVLVVDYLQLVGHAACDTREQAVSEIARRLKNLALETGIAVLTASQLNDDGRLRESRAIGHHADFVLGIADGGIVGTKCRRGPSGWSVPATLKGEIFRFE